MIEVLDATLPDTEEDFAGDDVMEAGTGTTGLLLKFISKLYDLLNKNEALKTEIQDLRNKQKGYEEKQADLLLRISNLEDERGQWTKVGGTDHVAAAAQPLYYAYIK